MLVHLLPRQRSRFRSVHHRAGHLSVTAQGHFLRPIGTLDDLDGFTFRIRTRPVRCRESTEILVLCGLVRRLTQHIGSRSQHRLADSLLGYHAVSSHHLVRGLVVDAVRAVVLQSGKLPVFRFGRILAAVAARVGVIHALDQRELGTFT